MSESTNSSSSVSRPIVTETPENAIIDQISSYAQQLAQQMNSWAQGVFAHTSQITDQAVGNFFQVSQKMLGLSNNLTDQYNNLFAPENAQLVADANSYASPARMAVDMGQAGATQAQAGSAALANSEEALRSYGINPADGRYAALDKAAAVQNAANVAGAENTQRNADIATGQRLRSEAVQVGAQLPAAIANVNNTAIQANTGASNSTLANANTGANLMKVPNDYLSTAMGVKLPLQGQQSSSQSSGQSSSPQKSSPSGGGSGGAGTGAGAHAGAGGGFNPAHGGGGQFSSNGLPGDYSFNDPTAGMTGDEFGGGNIYNPDPNGATMGVGNEGDNADIWGGQTGVNNNPFNDSGFGQTFGDQGNTFTGGAGAQDTEWGNINYDPSANQPADGGWDTSGAQNQYDPNANWGDASAFGDNSYNGGGDQTNFDTSNPGSDYYAGDYSSGSADDMGGAFARGGAVYAGGGAISPQASPSGGQQVDDIPSQMPSGAPARLNANEFVIPQDVALWKGQEFFQKLIDGSRKARMTAPAKPQPMMR